MRKGYQARVWVDCGNGPELKDYHNLTAGKSTKSISSVRKFKGFNKKLINLIGKRYDAILQRCYDPTNPRYPWYGGRGIKSEFTSREEFTRFCLGLPGYAPGMQLDRIDNNGNYSKRNLRWATPAVNVRNSTHIREVEVNGKTVCAKDAIADYTYLSYGFARSLLAQGWTIDRLACVPPGQKSPYYASFRLGKLRPKAPFHALEWKHRP